jgi:hypothetical protein
MERTLNRQTRFTILAFLAAPAVPALATLMAIAPVMITAPEKSALLFATVFSFYGYALFIAAPIAVPAFLVLRKRNLITWWSATFTGAIPPIALLLAFRFAEPLSYFSFSALGGLSGFVFWLVWRMGHRDEQVAQTMTGTAQQSTKVARSPSANAYVLSAIALFLSAWGWFYWHSRQEMNFDAAAWRENVQKKGYTNTSRRQRMADGLLRWNTLRGKTKAEVEAMLGPDSDSSYFREYDLVYWLGPERSFMRIDSEWLVIKFDDDGRVADVRLVTD